MRKVSPDWEFTCLSPYPKTKTRTGRRSRGLEKEDQRDWEFTCLSPYQNQTCAVQLAMSALGQKQTCAVHWAMSASANSGH